MPEDSTLRAPDRSDQHSFRMAFFYPLHAQYHCTSQRIIVSQMLVDRAGSKEQTVGDLISINISYRSISLTKHERRGQ